MRCVAFLLLLAAPALGQVEIIKRFDKDGNGTITPSEVPESRRAIYRRIVERAGLDPDKPVRIEELVERFERRVEKKLAEEEGIEISVTVTGARPRLYIRWPGQQGPPTKTVGLGLPPIKPRVRSDSRPPTRLPDSYARYDRDRDGQIGLYEWPRRRLAEFLELDRNQDGFLTPAELGVRRTSAPERREEGEASRSDEERSGSGAGGAASGPPVSPTPDSSQPPADIQAAPEPPQRGDEN